jgi:class 3 adenylate cyclase
VNAAFLFADIAGFTALTEAHGDEEAADLEGVLYEPRGRRELRNVREPVELFAAIRASTRPGPSSHATRCVAWLSTRTAPRGG